MRFIANSANESSEERPQHVNAPQDLLGRCLQQGFCEYIQPSATLDQQGDGPHHLARARMKGKPQLEKQLQIVLGRPLQSRSRAQCLRMSRFFNDVISKCKSRA